jgi:thiamine-monophosphate kinase
MRAPRFPQFRADSPGEATLIRQIRALAQQTQGASLRLGIGDDCALLRIGAGEELAVTTDLSVAGRHFRLDWHPPDSIGHRTLARGLSDLAAMGARPVAAFLSLGLPPSLVQKLKPRERRELRRGPRREEWFGGFLDGFLALARTCQTPLAGGDLTESSVPVADIVLTGAVRRGKAMLRSGARSGHLLYVTGSLGGAAAGLARLAQLAGGERNSRPRFPGAPHIPARLKTALEPHLYPQPRIKQGLWLARRSLASAAPFAAIDISDGLSTDLAHICDESGVAAIVDAAALPVYPGANLEQALHGGEDYELLFTAPPSARIPRRIAGLRITRIGRILRPRPSAPQVTLVTARGPQPLAPRGWQHFA